MGDILQTATEYDLWHFEVIQPYSLGTGHKIIKRTDISSDVHVRTKLFGEGDVS